MSEINTLHHHFRLDYLFEIKTTKSIDRNKIVFDDEGVYDFIGRSSANYGIQGKIGHLGYEPNAANTFSLVQVGESCCLFRETPWYASQNIFILKPRFPELVDVQLYITCVLNKSLEIYKEAYKYPTLSVLKGIKIQLPVSCNGTPDWNYMQERIAELEQERIAELEQYLVAAGLNDYELNDEDRKILELKVEKKTFRMGELFTKLKARYLGNGRRQDNVSRYKSEEFSLPLINCKDGNNGIMYYGRVSDFTVHRNVLSIIYNGPPTEGQTYYQDIIGLFSDAYLITLKNEAIMSREVGLYLTTAINKSIHNIQQKRYSRGNKATWNFKVENDVIFLPIQTNEEGHPIIDPEREYHAEGYIPDWDYMTSYIRAMKKVVIADVVKYKDEVIAKTRALVSAK